MNLWKEGFETKSFKVLTLPLAAEIDLEVLSRDLSSYIIYNVESETHKSYISLDQAKLFEALKGKELKEKLELAAEVLTTLLGEDEVRNLNVYSYFFVIISLAFEIREFKESLKKK